MLPDQAPARFDGSGASAGSGAVPRVRLLVWSFRCSGSGSGACLVSGSCFSRIPAPGSSQAFWFAASAPALVLGISPPLSGLLIHGDVRFDHGEDLVNIPEF